MDYVTQKKKKKTWTMDYGILYYKTKETFVQ